MPSEPQPLETLLQRIGRVTDAILQVSKRLSAKLKFPLSRSTGSPRPVQCNIAIAVAFGVRPTLENPIGRLILAGTLIGITLSKSSLCSLGADRGPQSHVLAFCHAV